MSSEFSKTEMLVIVLMIFPVLGTITTLPDWLGAAWRAWKDGK